MYSTQGYSKKDYTYLSISLFIFGAILSLFSSPPDYKDLTFIKGEASNIYYKNTKFGSKAIVELSGSSEINEIKMPRFNNIFIQKGDFIEAGVKKDFFGRKIYWVWALDVNDNTLLNYDFMVDHEAGNITVVSRIIMFTAFLMFLYGIFFRRTPKTALDRVRQKNKNK